MTKEQLTEMMIAEVMESFDFDKVHRTMELLDWKWNIGNDEMVVPSTYRLMKAAERMLHDVAKFFGEKEYYASGSGGFVATLNDNELSLKFVLEEITSYEEDFETIND